MQTQASSEQVSSASMLGARLSANAAASRDFDEWCIGLLPELPPAPRVLDLGCGNGKQLLLFSQFYPPESHFMGIDLSGESLRQIQDRYLHAPRLTLIEGSFDELERHPELEEGRFDLIYASYALYYTKKLPHVIRQAFRLLRRGGYFWVIGPHSGTNAEFLRILRPLHEVEPFMDYVFDTFPLEVVREAAKEGFSTYKPSLLRNQVPFASAEAFLAYLRNSLFYRPGHDEAIQAAVAQRIEQEGSFRVSKNVASLLFRK